MISQDTDGLYRGNMYKGTMNGETMIYFLLMKKSSLAKSTALSKWIKGWVDTREGGGGVRDIRMV